MKGIVHTSLFKDPANLVLEQRGRETFTVIPAHFEGPLILAEHFHREDVDIFYMGVYGNMKKHRYLSKVATKEKGLQLFLLQPRPLLLS